MLGYNRLRKFAQLMLNTELSADLVYHGIHHTLEVLDNVNFLIKKEKISINDSKLLRIAALFHDIGFIKTYKNHEAIGVDILKSAMEKFDCNMKDFPKIASMIMATKIPQNPKNNLENIICDSDLFYLGRNKYYKISDTLFKELLKYNLIKTKKQWNDIQVNFLSNHSYHTKYAKENLEKEKRNRVEEINQP